MTRSDRRYVGQWLMGLVIVASVNAQEPSRPRASTPEAVLARLRERIGLDLTECGRHPLSSAVTLPADYTETVQASVQCVIDAAAQQRPSWMFVQQRGIDSWVATGLVSGADGAIRKYDYDSDPSGGSNAAATLFLTPCAAPTVTNKGGVLLECKPATAGR